VRKKALLFGMILVTAASVLFSVRGQAADLSQKAIRQERKKQEKMIGRIRFRDAAIDSVRLFASADQRTVDRKDSAMIWCADRGLVIGDHRNQNGFSKLRKSEKGDRLEIRCGDRTIRFECVGIRKNVRLQTELGFSAFRKALGRSHLEGILLIYTCEKAGFPKVCITEWKCTSGSAAFEKLYAMTADYMPSDRVY